MLTDLFAAIAESRLPSNLTTPFDKLEQHYHTRKGTSQSHYTKQSLLPWLYN